MKRLLFGLLLAAAPMLLSPLPASAAEFKTYVGCDDLADTPTPAQVCQLGDFPGAYFESSADTEYEICIEFPNEDVLCGDEELAEGGALYVNSIVTGEAGTHFVSWYVEGVEVGSWSFRMDAPAPPPLPPTPVIPAPAIPAPPAVSIPSAKCLTARQQISKLKGQLKKASGHKQRVKIQGKLRNARATANHAC
jgi:hypothetical protein